MTFYELNLDGLVGPTHHYAGLAIGNIASTSNALNLSNPQAAARQGLAKMRLLAQMGLKQGLLPPHQRPNLGLLDQLGFSGTASQQIEKAHRASPELLSACYSASSMWTANAATITPSLDSQDQRVHFTAANLISNLHRYQEADFSKTLLEKMFSDEQFFTHHQILPRSLAIGDEGAANHNRLCLNHGNAGTHLFVYGKKASDHGPKKYPARQTLEASQAIARLHQLDPEQVIFARQNPKVIDQGVFHNDVIAVANESVLLLHQEAFMDQAKICKELKTKTNFNLQIIEVPSQRISVMDAIKTYFFNSQLITLPCSKKMALIAPIECQENPRVNAFIAELLLDEANPINVVHYLDLKQSMRNGGGPACLRLRIPLAEYELQAMHQPVLIIEPLLDAWDEWVIQFYRDLLHANDLADPLFINECFLALEALTKLLHLGNIYPFQY